MDGMSRDEKQQWVRENLPTCAELAASFQAALGDVRLVYASENGHTLGQRSPDGIPLSETWVGTARATKRS